MYFETWVIVLFFTGFVKLTVVKLSQRLKQKSNLCVAILFSLASLHFDL